MAKFSIQSPPDSVVQRCLMTMLDSIDRAVGLECVDENTVKVYSNFNYIVNLWEVLLEVKYKETGAAYKYRTFFDESF